MTTLLPPRSTHSLISALLCSDLLSSSGRRGRKHASRTCSASLCLKEGGKTLKKPKSCRWLDSEVNHFYKAEPVTSASDSSSSRRRRGKKGGSELRSSSLTLTSSPSTPYLKLEHSKSHFSSTLNLPYLSSPKTLPSNKRERKETHREDRQNPETPNPTPYLPQLSLHTDCRLYNLICSLHITLHLALPSSPTSPDEAEAQQWARRVPRWARPSSRLLKGWVVAVKELCW